MHQATACGGTLRIPSWIWGILIVVSCFAPCGVPRALASSDKAQQRLEWLDRYVQDVMKLWNVPGMGVGIVADGKLILARGYGSRDLARKLPFTSRTLFPIGSNTKLFTAVAAGLLVQDGSLSYDLPIRQCEPSIRFSSDALNDNVTLRDMLAHRTGITRHDGIWYDTDRTARDLYERLRYLEPAAPLRTTFLYNNLMYAAVGRIIEIESGLSYPQFIRQRILHPLAMDETVFSVAEMRSAADYALPYDEARGSSRLVQIPYYGELSGLQAAGALISNVDELSHWLIALMDRGRFGGREVLAPAAVAETMVPALALAQTDDTPWTDGALLGASYGLARFIAVYRGHLLAYHGGHIDGYRAQISLMPNDRLGVIVLVMGEHTGFLYDAVTFNIYEHLLGLSPSSSVMALRKTYLDRKAAAGSARESEQEGKVEGTRPSHELADYVGDYANPAYGVLEVRLQSGQLQFGLNHLHRPLSFFHYDRFDTGDDDLDGKQSLNFITGSQGTIERVTVSLDEADVTFSRAGPTPSSAFLARVVGTYEAPGGALVAIQRTGNALTLSAFGAPDLDLTPYRDREFRIASLQDTLIEFKEQDDVITGFYRRSPGGKYFYRRR